MFHLSKKAKVIVAGVALSLLAGTGTAYAYWSTTGSGSGSGTTSAGASNLTITQTSTIANMYPGDAPQTISGTVKNNAANSAYVAAVTVSISSVSGGAGTCDATDYTLANPTMTVATDLAANATTTFSGATLQFNNKTTSQDGCKGATVNLAYASS